MQHMRDILIGTTREALSEGEAVLSYSIQVINAVRHGIYSPSARLIVLWCRCTCS